MSSRRGNRGGRGGRREATVRTPQEQADQLMSEAAASETKAERYKGEEGRQSFRNAFQKFNQVLDLVGISEDVRQEALEGSARCQLQLAELAQTPSESFNALHEARIRFERVFAQDPRHSDSIYNLALIAAKQGDLYRESGDRTQAVQSYDQAVRLFDQTLQLLATLPDKIYEGMDTTRLDDQVEAANSLGEVLCQAAEFIPDPALFIRAFNTYEQILRLDTESQHPEIKIGWANALFSQAKFTWENTPKTVLAIPSASLEHAVNLLTDALSNEFVNPAEALCLRADIYYEYAWMLIELLPSFDASAFPASPVVLLSLALRDLSTSCELENNNPDILSKVGDVWLGMYKCPQSPNVAEAGTVQALNLALQWYQRSFTVPFKPYHDPDTLYNAASVFSLLKQYDQCRERLLLWLRSSSGNMNTDPRLAPFLPRALAESSIRDLQQDKDFESFLQSNVGASFFNEILALTIP